jgi:shikimate dehydrogenase
MLNKFNHSTKVIGVLGHPIKHSFSPLMHNLSFELLELDYIYLPFDVPLTNLKDSLKGIKALGIMGFNVTLPLKEKIIQYIDELSEEASIVGAVNTIVNDNGVLRGYNTDVNGIVVALENHKDKFSGKEATVIGSGGAARSVIYSLIRNFKMDKINLINRTVQRAESLRDYFESKMRYDNFKTYELVPPDVVNILKGSQLIVNTTSIGMFPEIDDSPTSIEQSFHSDQVVFDVVYNPVKTKFLKIAESAGASVVSGLEMFVEQGKKSFELWTGEEMPSDKIYATLKGYLEK